ATRISAVESRSCIGVLRGGNCEIGQKPISNPKSEISDWTDVQLQISDLRYRIRPISNFPGFTPVRILSPYSGASCRRRSTSPPLGFIPIAEVQHLSDLGLFCNAGCAIGHIGQGSGKIEKMNKVFRTLSVVKSEIQI